MTEKQEATAAAGRTNSVQPDPVAAPAPCGCEERVGKLEGRLAAQDALNRAMSWCMLAAAAAVIYILWTGAGNVGKALDK
jgi:hypothetical protein